MRGSRAYWACQLAGWGATIALNMAFVAGYDSRYILTFVAIYCWGAITGIGLSHAWRAFMLRRGWFVTQARVPWPALAAGVLAFGALQVAAVALAFLVLQPPGAFKSFAWLPGALSFWSLVFLVWTAIYALVASGRRTRRLESQALQLRVDAKEAELRALQAQVNPHFFFNSLNSIRALIYESPDAAARMVDQLAAMMRYTLQSGAGHRVPLAQEIEAVNVYLAIEKIRFEERLRSVVSVEPGLEELWIPPMALQTLVENAVKYGVERNPAGCEVRITVGREKDGRGAVRIEVANEGALASGAESTRVGLDNTRRRLALAIGGEADLQLAERGGWVVATLVLPAPA